VKFLKIDAFEKHIKEALPDHPSSVYTLLISDAFERKFVRERLWEAWDGQDKIAVSLDDLSEAISSPSLFAEKRCLVSDEIEKYKKNDFESLLPILETLPRDLLLIMGGSSLKAFPSFYETMKKEMVLLDLTGEKPWDRKNRLHRWILEFAHEKGKSLAPDAATYLLDFSPIDFSMLIQEVDKAATFVGEDRTITLQAVKAVCHFKGAQRGWELSEALIWGGSIHYPSLHHLDSAAFYGFVGQLRYQLKLGVLVATALEKGEEETIMREYPRLRPKALEKYKTQAERFTSSYFLKGMQALFDLELKSRSGIDTTLLLDLFAFKLQRGRFHATITSP